MICLCVLARVLHAHRTTDHTNTVTQSMPPNNQGCANLC